MKTKALLFTVLFSFIATFTFANDILLGIYPLKEVDLYDIKFFKEGVVDTGSGALFTENVKFNDFSLDSTSIVAVNMDSKKIVYNVVAVYPDYHVGNEEGIGGMWFSRFVYLDKNRELRVMVDIPGAWVFGISQSRDEELTK